MNVQVKRVSHIVIYISKRYPIKQYKAVQFRIHYSSFSGWKLLNLYKKCLGDPDGMQWFTYSLKFPSRGRHIIGRGGVGGHLAPPTPIAWSTTAVVLWTTCCSEMCLPTGLRHWNMYTHISNTNVRVG